MAKPSVGTWGIGDSPTSDKNICTTILKSPLKGQMDPNLVMQDKQTGMFTCILLVVLKSKSGSFYIQVGFRFPYMLQLSLRMYDLSVVDINYIILIRETWFLSPSQCTLVFYHKICSLIPKLSLFSASLAGLRRYFYFKLDATLTQPLEEHWKFRIGTNNLTALALVWWASPLWGCDAGVQNNMSTTPPCRYPAEECLKSGTLTWNGTMIPQEEEE